MLKSRTLIATPAYRGEVVGQYAHCLVRDSFLAMMRGHFVEAPLIIPDTIPCVARAKAVREFMGSECDYLMMIDADMGWQHDALGEMLELPPEMDIVCGIYRQRIEARRYVIHSLPDVPLTYPVSEIKMASAGFMRITRGCLERMLKAYPNGRLFSHITDENDEEFSEDFSFCMRARAAGCKVYAKLDIAFDHVGPHAWRGAAHKDLNLPEVKPAQGELGLAA